MKINQLLPKFDNPPVIETLVGVQFKPLAAFSIPYFGLYWTRISQRYPRVEVRSPLGDVVERFDHRPYATPRITIETADTPEVRCWFIDGSGTRLIQVQRARFIHNWRKANEDDKYIHYDNIRPRFFEEWLTFCSFLNDQNMDRPVVTQCEISYINHIKLGEGWKSYAELNEVLSFWGGGHQENSFLPDPETVNVQISYALPDKRGRLHLQTQRAIRTKDSTEVLQVNLTARGEPRSSTDEDILEWLDLGHEWIVNGFASITTKKMHKVWGRTV